MSKKVSASEIKSGDIILREVIDYRESTDSWKNVAFRVDGINTDENWVDLTWESGLDFGRFAIINSGNMNEQVTLLDSFNEVA